MSKTFREQMQELKEATKYLLVTAIKPICEPILAFIDDIIP